MSARGIKAVLSAWAVILGFISICIGAIYLAFFQTGILLLLILGIYAIGFSLDVYFDNK